MPHAESVRHLAISGSEAMKCVGVSGMLRSNILAINKGRWVVEITDVAQMHENDGVLEQIVAGIH